MQLSRDALLRAYRQMKVIREFEERLHTEIQTAEASAHHEQNREHQRSDAKDRNRSPGRRHGAATAPDTGGHGPGHEQTPGLRDRVSQDGAPRNRR